MQIFAISHSKVLLLSHCALKHKYYQEIVSKYKKLENAVPAMKSKQNIFLTGKLPFRVLQYKYPRMMWLLINICGSIKPHGTINPKSMREEIHS